MPRPSLKNSHQKDLHDLIHANESTVYQGKEPLMCFYRVLQSMPLDWCIHFPRYRAESSIAVNDGFPFENFSPLLCAMGQYLLLEQSPILPLAGACVLRHCGSLTSGPSLWQLHFASNTELWGGLWRGTHDSSKGPGLWAPHRTHWYQTRVQEYKPQSLAGSFLDRKFRKWGLRSSLMSSWLFALFMLCSSQLPFIFSSKSSRWSDAPLLFLSLLDQGHSHSLEIYSISPTRAQSGFIGRNTRKNTVIFGHKVFSPLILDSRSQALSVQSRHLALHSSSSTTGKSLSIYWIRGLQDTLIAPCFHSVGKCTSLDSSVIGKRP